MNFKDYTNQYSNLVTFTPNKNTPIHRWYPLVEGYSTDFVRNIIEEQEFRPEFCFDPFGGIGKNQNPRRFAGSGRNCGCG